MNTLAIWHGCEILVYEGDITLLHVDAVVNAANAWLMGGGGVDGAIHDRGGPSILAACQAIIATRGLPLEAGDAVITEAGNLPAQAVIHAVGPIYYKTEERQRGPELLASCYRRAMGLARERGLVSIAFPCISTGAYGYPHEEACAVALTTVREELAEHGGLTRVIFCTFSPDDTAQYESMIPAMD